MSDEDSGGGGGGGGEGGGALAALYHTHALYVQRKSGALSYVDDPSGVRSLLSTAFHKVTVCRLPCIISRLTDSHLKFAFPGFAH